MPLHDWADRPGWEGVHTFWMTELARWLKGRLPVGYRAYIGASPMLGIDSITARPSISVQNVPYSPARNGASGSVITTVEAVQPDVEVAVAVLHEEKSVLVEREGRLISAVEIVSPRNKDRPESRAHYGMRYVSYLKNGVHLLLADVHARPREFSFGALIGAELGIAGPAFSAPLALSYRVGEPAAEGGRLLGVWQRKLKAGDALPSLPLALSGQEVVIVDLEETYHRAASDAYLE